MRTNPYSRYQADFRGQQFGDRLLEAGIRYIFMGHRIGGKPTSPHLLTEGRPDPEKLRSERDFQVGIDRLVTASGDREKVICLLCGCGKAAECHRGTLLGEVLDDQGVSMLHINPKDEIESQEDIRQQITKGQPTLF